MNKPSIPLVHTSISKKKLFNKKINLSLLEKRWYEYLQPKIDHSSLQLSESAHLTVMGDFFNDSIKLLVANINPVLILTQFYHLVIDTKTIFSDELVDILYRLPNIISLKLHSVTLFPSFDEEERRKSFLLGVRNK